MRLGTVALLCLLLGLAGPAGAEPVEDYASYVAPQRCHARPLPGTVALGRWVTARYRDSAVGFGRACRKKDGPTSEHQTGRAFDWSMDATTQRDRRTVRQFLRRIFAADQRGEPDAWARRMGVLYVIWDDEIYPAWDGFHPEPYLSSGCATKRKCSVTLRHRDHVHVSLSRAGAQGRTSWYRGRL